jgi:very-short-patch-repair endonuclease
MRVMTERSRRMRKNPTESEKELKNILLRNKIKFRTQKEFHYYILDFIIINKRLVIEIDGGYHYSNKQLIKDKIRDRYLKNNGFIIKRFKNDEVFNNPSGIINYINSLEDSPVDMDMFYRTNKIIK